MKQSVAERFAISGTGEIANTERFTDETADTRASPPSAQRLYPPVTQRPTVTAPADVWS